MPHDLHHHYDQLTEAERTFVDLACAGIFTLRKSTFYDVIPPLDGSDPAERVADAIARWVIDSRDNAMDPVHDVEERSAVQ